MKKVLVLGVSLSVLMLGSPANVSAIAPSKSPADTLPALTPAPEDALTRALETGRLTEAEYTFERALSLFEPKVVARRFGEIAALDPREATLVLRDLVLRKRELSGADRASAAALLARPTDERGGDPINIKYGGADAKRTCSTDLCVHYVTEGKHQVDATDADANGLPDYVDTVVTVMQQVWDQEVVTYGFRKPKGDLSSRNDGGNQKIDFYLGQLGDRGLYGYCTSDDPNVDRAINGTYKFSDMSAYCVVDNDYSPAEYPGQTPLENLQVTGAHEFFHAVQFAYDLFEDLWILESTATWVEDEVFDDINDNLQFLNPSSAMRTPRVSLDFGDPSSGFPYGNFIFWRYASETFGRKVVRQVWNQADGAKGGPNLYSLAATRHVLERKSSFGKVFSQFALANFLPDNYYSEGASYRMATGGGARANKSFTLGKFNPRTPSESRRLDHLASSYFLFKRGKGVGSGTRLKVNVDGPGIKSKPKALLVALDGSKVVSRRFIRLNGRGAGSAKVPFGTATRALLVLSNASTRFKDCFKGFRSPYSCAGRPVDQNKVFNFKASLIR